MEHTLLSEEHQLILKAAANKKNPEELNKAIGFVQMVAFKKFLTEADLEKRVFYHRPAGMYWSGTAISTKSAYK
jgi:hypothetical protein